MGQTEASSAQWLRADVWSLGLTLCSALCLDFHLIKIAGPRETAAHRRLMLERLVGFRPAGSNARTPGLVSETPRFGWPRDVPRRVGAHGVDFLDALLAWAPLARPTSAECRAHMWLQLQ